MRASVASVASCSKSGELALEFPEAPVQPDRVAERLFEYITRGQPLELTLTMTVCDMHQAWDDLWERGRRAEVGFCRFASVFEARRTGQPPADKRRLRQLAERAEQLAADAKAIPEWVMVEAQTVFAATHLAGLDDTICDNFWMDIGYRPGTEYTWKLTLGYVLDYLRHYDEEKVLMEIQV